MGVENDEGKKCQIGSLLEVPDLYKTSHLTPKTVNQTALRFTLHPLPGPPFFFFFFKNTRLPDLFAMQQPSAWKKQKPKSNPDEMFAKLIGSSSSMSLRERAIEDDSNWRFQTVHAFRPVGWAKQDCLLFQRATFDWVWQRLHWDRHCLGGCTRFPLLP